VTSTTANFALNHLREFNIKYKNSGDEAPWFSDRARNLTYKHRQFQGVLHCRYHINGIVIKPIIETYEAHGQDT